MDVVVTNFVMVASVGGMKVVVVREQDQKSESMRRGRSFGCFAERSFNGLRTIFGEAKVDHEIQATNLFNDTGFK